MDPRVDRSRTALKQALFKLLLTRTYASITIEDIAHCAGVSRSTFYVHFRDKDTLLGGSVSGQTAVLSQLAAADGSERAIAMALDHFLWAGPAALAMLTSDVRSIVSATLASQIDAHLRARGLHARGRLLVPSPLLSAMLADAVLSGIRTWMSSTKRLASADFAYALLRQAGGLIDASCVGQLPVGKEDGEAIAC